MNQAISTGAARATAVNNRVPEPILYFLIIGSILAVGFVGYDSGLALRRSLIAAVLLVALFTRRSISSSI